MDEALHFVKVYEVWIYLLLGLGGVIYLRKFIQAWHEFQGAIFGLERESAQNRLNQAASVLALLIMMAVGEFVLVSFVAPLRPEASPLPTPTIDLLASPTTTLASPGIEMEADAVPLTSTPLPTIALDTGECVPDRIQITFPKPDEEVRGEVAIRGTADIPNFGFYKLEYAQREEPLWLTIQAGRTPVQEGDLVELWDTTRLPPGEYILQLVIVDNTGQPLPPCRIPIRVVMP